MPAVALVVDDEPDIVEIVSMHIETLGIDSVGASRISAGKNLLETKTFDFILSDVRMPEGSGVDLLNWLRNERKDITTPLFLMTGFSDVTIDEAYAMGANGFFMKPLDFGALRETFLRLSTKATKEANAVKESVTQTICIDIPSLASPAELQFGRIGCFVSPETEGLRVSDVVQLNVTGPELTVECFGIVRWKRRSNVEGRIKGVGIEFLLPPVIVNSSLVTAGSDWKASPWAQTVASIPLGNSEF